MLLQVYATYFGTWPFDRGLRQVVYGWLRLRGKQLLLLLGRIVLGYCLQARIQVVLDVEELAVLELHATDSLMEPDLRFLSAPLLFNLLCFLSLFF